VGTFALVLFGYCLMARILSLLPGNRTEPVSLDLILRTFLTPPDAYVLEGRIASLSAHTKGCKN